MDEYPRIFIEANGPGPWTCYGCQGPVVVLAVHHLDEDRSNNDPTNLVAVHQPCHVRLHMEGKPKSAEHRAKISDALRGKTKTEEHKRKISEANRGRKHTVESRRNMSVAHTGKPHPHAGKRS